MNSQDISRFLSLQHEPGEVVELRVPSTSRGTQSGYFSDVGLLAQAVAMLNGKVPGVYATLNPVRPELLARGANKVNVYAKHTTSDADILQRRWIPVDFDPVRPAGISSTEKEHTAALDRAQLCREWLRSQGWPDPIFADSGNGAHLLYRVDLPNDPNSTEVVKRCLQALDLRFSDEKVSVDVSTFNAGRIWKVYGTMAAKGASTPERPHRMAEILEFPPQIESVLPSLLSAVASAVPEQQKRNRQGSFDVERWLNNHDINIVSSTEWKGGRRWVLTPCPWNPEHTNASAFVVQLPGGGIAAGCRHNGCSGEDWTTLRELYGDSDGVAAKEPKQSQVDCLLELGAEAQLFHTPDGDAYATIVANGHPETWAIKSKSFRQWLLHRYYAERQGAPNSQALQEAIATFESRASFDGPEISVSVRLAESDGKIYLDLGNKDWNAVEIDADGWRVVTNPPVKFHRAKGIKPLPDPVRGGSIEELRQFTNLSNEHEWKLLVGWLIGTLRTTGPYPVLVLNGEQGCAKSTTAKVARELTDPNIAGLRSEPKDVRDVMIAARNGRVISLDNLSHIPAWLSDALCRLATGGAFSTRQLYENTEEVLIEAQRPVILNGIEELTTRSDLLDRAIVLSLPCIAEGKRRSEREFWAAFGAAQPRILGALLDAVVCALRRYPEIRLQELPRMADFALWVTAAEPALGWTAGSFMQAYSGNRTSANDLALDASPLSSAIRSLASENSWEGTATELLSALALQVSSQVAGQRGWPTSTRALSNALRRLAPNFRAAGIEISFKRGTGRLRPRIISIVQSPVASQSDQGLDASDASDARVVSVNPARDAAIEI